MPTSGADLPRQTEGNQAKAQSGGNGNSQQETSPGQHAQEPDSSAPTLSPAVEQAYALGDTRVAMRALAEKDQPQKEKGTTPIPPDLVPGYRERLVGIGDRLDMILAKAPDALQFGPNYSVSMPDGSTQQVMTLYYDIPGKTNETMGNSDSYRRFHIIALDTNGNPVADRYTTVHYMNLQGKRYAFAEGMIATGIRGAGLTAPIELAHMDVIQREANRLDGLGYDNGIQFHISNANLENLQALEAQYAESKDAGLLPQIEAQRAEQQRWQSIYGPQGWLGFNTSWERVFTPESQGERLETSRGVDITRVDGKPTVQRTIPLSSEDEVAYREAQLVKLRTMVGRIKTIVTPQATSN